MDLSLPLKLCLSSGNAIYNGFEISSECLLSNTPDNEKLRNVLSSSIVLLADLDLSSVKIFVYAHEQDNYNGNNHGLSNGSPLSFNDDALPSEVTCVNNSKLLDMTSVQTFMCCLLHTEPSVVLKSLPMLIFTNGFQNKENTFMIYLQEHSRDITTSKRKNDVDGNSFILVKTIRCEGSLPSQVWKLNRLNRKDIPNDDQVVKHYTKTLALPYHMQLTGEAVSAKSLFTVKSLAQFQLFNESHSQMEPFDQFHPVASISLDVSCDKISRLFAIDSMHISSITVNVTPVPGDFRSPAHCLFKDIDVLDGLLQGFRPENNVKWSDCTFDPDQDDDSSPVKSIQESLNDVFHYFNSYSTSHDVKSNKSEQSDDEEVLNLIVQRQELDFTEKVWGVLKFVQSFQQLVDCLSMVFSEIKQGRTDQFWLHEDGDSRLFEEIKNSYQGKFSNQPLVGLYPMQVLVEIGIDKLKRDYVDFFVSHRYSSAARLQPFFAPPASTEVADRLLEKFCGLKKLHHVTELAAYCHTYLQLPVTNIQKIVRSALQEYTQSDVDFKKTFSFPASYSDVRLHLEGCVPSLWKMSVTGSSEQGKCTGSACWTTNFPFSGLFDPISHQCDISRDNESYNGLALEDESDSALYYMTTVTESLYPFATQI